MGDDCFRVLLEHFMHCNQHLWVVRMKTAFWHLVFGDHGYFNASMLSLCQVYQMRLLIAVMQWYIH